MKKANFSNHHDNETFAPFELVDCRHEEWSDVRLSFSGWDWLQETHGTDEIQDYYLNGYGVQGLVIAARVKAGLEKYPNGMEPNSEGDTCYIHFSNFEMALETAALAQEMILDYDKLVDMVVVARENDLED